MRKIIFFGSLLVLIMMVFSVLTPLSAAECHSGPKFKIYLGTAVGNGFQYGAIQIYVKNIGDATAHNVTLTDFQMEGLVVYNNRGVDWGHSQDANANDIEPGEQIAGYLETCVIGFGRFTTTMNVTCDEGIDGTGTGNGVIFGFIIFIP